MNMGEPTLPLPPPSPHAGCRRQLDKCSPDDPDTLVNTGCVLFKEGKYEPARQRFNEALSILGYKVCGGTARGRGQEGKTAYQALLGQRYNDTFAVSTGEGGGGHCVVGEEGAV